MDLLNNKKFIKYIKTAGLGFLCIFIYFISTSLELGLLKAFNIDYKNMDLTLKVIYLITWDVVIACSLLLVLNKKITKDFKNMLKNHKKYFKKYVKYYLIALAIMMISNLFINTFINNNIAANEEAIRETFQISPIYVFLTSVIFAPLIEELVFRQSIRNIIPNKVIFVLVSGLIFGSLHVLTGYSGPTDLLYLIPYCAPGFAFAYILADSDNIFISVSLHCMHNGVIVALQFLLLFLGLNY
jgi:membrane protease YdiL (CAAX protease family)